MTRNQLQTALKELRNQGADVQIKLNAKTELLQTEYDRLMAKEQSSEPVIMTAEDFNAWVGLPTDTIQPTAMPEAQEQENAEDPGLSLYATCELTCDICNGQLCSLPLVDPELQASTPETAYWVDGTELGLCLEATQAQAMRNLQDGLSWVRGMYRNLKAFGQGFKEGLKQPALKSQADPKLAEVVLLDRSRRLPKVA